MKLIIVIVVGMLCLAVNSAPQSQVFGRGECNQPNTEFKRCEFSTRATCLVPQPNPDRFAADCEDGCFCIRGYYYNSNNQCVLLRDCKNRPQVQEEYEQEDKSENEQINEEEDENDSEE